MDNTSSLGLKFEAFVSKFLKVLGYQVEYTDHDRAKYIPDFRITRNDFSIIVEVKFYRSRQGVTRINIG